MSKKEQITFKVVKNTVSNDVKKAYEKAIKKFKTRKRFIEVKQDDKCFIFTKIR